MKVQKSVEINASPEKIWAFVVDPEKILKWYIPLQKFEYTSEQHNEVGATFNFEEKVAGREMKLDCVVTEWEENEVFAFEMTSGNMMKSYTERWTVETAPGGGKFTFMEQGELPFGILNSVIGPIVARGSAATVVKMLQELKTLAEGEM